MIRTSDLIGCELKTESGRKLGKVHDLRAEAVNDEWQLVGLVVGRGGMAARLLGTSADPWIGGDVIPWQAITRLEDGLLTVRDET